MTVGVGVRARLDLAASQALWGDFSLLAHAEHGLLLARGRFGGRPLFYTRDFDRARALVACSRLAPLVRLIGRGTIDRERLCAFVATTSADDVSRTHYRELARVPAGTAMLIRSDGRRQIERRERTQRHLVK